MDLTIDLHAGQVEGELAAASWRSDTEVMHASRLDSNSRVDDRGAIHSSLAGKIILFAIGLENGAFRFQVYENGKGVPKDMDQALRLYRLAAEGGSARAQESLGELYEFGQAVQTDYQEAARWYRRAIEGGDALSASQLATMLFEGKGGTRDLPEAIRLWSWAAQQGEPLAQFNLAEVYMKGIGVSKDLKKSLSLFAQAAKKFDVSKRLKEVSSQMEQEETAELR